MGALETFLLRRSSFGRGISDKKQWTPPPTTWTRLNIFCKTDRSSTSIPTLIQMIPRLYNVTPVLYSTINESLTVEESQANEFQTDFEIAWSRDMYQNIYQAKRGSSAQQVWKLPKQFRSSEIAHEFHFSLANWKNNRYRRQRHTTATTVHSQDTVYFKNLAIRLLETEAEESIHHDDSNEEGGEQEAETGT